MKKRFLALMISVTMMAVLCTGCGEKETTSGDETKVSVEESNEATPAPVSEERVEESVPESSEEVVESTVESKEEVAESEDVTVEVSEEKVAEVMDADGKDWSTAYGDYFQREDIMPKKVLITATTVAEGVTFDLNVATADDVMWMGYDFGTAAFDMYATKEKVYARYAMAGEEAWVWAPVESEDEVSSVTDMADTTMVDTDSISATTYREAIEENGIIYDVLDVTVEEEGTTAEAVYFVNRETQLVEKCVMEQDGASVICLIKEIEMVEIPAAAATATEGTMEDVMGAMLGVLFMGATAGME